MLRFLLRRFFSALILFFLSSTLVFLALSFGTADPAEVILRENITPESAHALRQKLGLTDPLYVQYFRFAGNIIRGDLGNSWYTQKPVVEQVFAAFPFTLSLTISATLIALVLGLAGGIAGAYYQGTWIDEALKVGTLAGVSLPNFIIALLASLIFAYYLGWFPLFGAGSAAHLVLPSLSIGIYVAAVLARMTRSAMLDVFHQEYIEAARAKGMPEFVVITRHAFRNALIPIITVFGLHFGVLMGGTFVTEVVFSWPGMGRLMVNAILARDFPVVQGAALVFLFTFFTVNFLIDLIYVLVDPRIKWSD